MRKWTMRKATLVALVGSGLIVLAGVLLGSLGVLAVGLGLLAANGAHLSTLARLSAEQRRAVVLEGKLAAYRGELPQ